MKELRINIMDGRLAKTAKKISREKALKHKEEAAYASWSEEIKTDIVHSVSHPLEGGRRETDIYTPSATALTVKFVVEYIRSKIEARANNHTFDGTGYSIPGTYAIRGRKENKKSFVYFVRFSLQGNNRYKTCVMKRIGGF